VKKVSSDTDPGKCFSAARRISANTSLAGDRKAIFSSPARNLETLLSEEARSRWYTEAVIRQRNEENRRTRCCRSLDDRRRPISTADPRHAETVARLSLARAGLARLDELAETRQRLQRGLDLELARLTEGQR
jgi:hypothetical protein